MNKTLQQIAAKVIREMTTEPVINWRKVARIERRFHLVGYSFRVLDALYESRRAYIKIQSEREQFANN